MKQILYFDFSCDFLLPRKNYRDKIIEIGKSHEFNILDLNCPSNKPRKNSLKGSIVEIFPTLVTYKESIESFFKSLDPQIKNIYVKFSGHYNMRKTVKDYIFLTGRQYNFRVYEVSKHTHAETIYNLDDLYTLDLNLDYIEKYFSFLETRVYYWAELYINFLALDKKRRETIINIGDKYGIRVINYRFPGRGNHVEKPDYDLKMIIKKPSNFEAQVENFFINYTETHKNKI